MLSKTVSVVLLTAAAFGAETIPTPKGVIAHEWGTFTSVADMNGAAIRWFALGGAPKLPDFVHRPQWLGKAQYAFVRMETPVIYFYAPRAATLSVDVRLPRGVFTEWYPAAQTDAPQHLEWAKVQVDPDSTATLPSGGEGSHYYAARATDAAPLRVGVEHEKLLFYRGVADFDVPIRPRFTADGRIEVSGDAPVAIVFENRGGKIGYRVLHALRGTTVVDVPALDSSAAAVRRELAAELVQAGLYPKEADAMLETWRDSWFESGLRIIYLMPRVSVDLNLPLKIAPAASETARVFVGRVEMMSPAMAREIETAVQARDRAALAKYGRFLQAFWEGLHGVGQMLPSDLQR